MEKGCEVRDVMFSRAILEMTSFRSSVRAHRSIDKEEPLKGLISSINSIVCDGVRLLIFKQSSSVGGTSHKIVLYNASQTRSCSSLSRLSTTSAPHPSVEIAGVQVRLRVNLHHSCPLVGGLSETSPLRYRSLSGLCSLGTTPEESIPYD